VSNLEGDYDQYLADRRHEADQKHEQTMRSTRLKVAKIEAARDVKVARARDANYLTYRWGVSVVALAAVIAVCITYSVTRPADPEERRLKQEQYELCMEVENDYEKCQYAGD
jgi:hypothetical protein